MPVLEPSSFEHNLAWSLAGTNTSAAVRLLHTVWPRRYWVLSCNTSDKAGEDMEGLLEGRPPIGIDVKYRRGEPRREEPDVAIDCHYIQPNGEKWLAPMLRPEPIPVPFWLYVWPEAEHGPYGILLDTRRTQWWLRDNDYWTAFRRYKTPTSSWGQEWVTQLIFPAISTLNLLAGSDVARVLGPLLPS